MIYGSVCSGIEAATVAWEPLGWKPAFFSEIEPFPRALLSYRYPGVKCHGDFTTIKGDEFGPIDLLVGGTPCQDFSVAGLRAGIAGERGNLTLEFLRLAARARPHWIVWENVPGVLSSDGGRAFGAFLGGLAELGYGFAYRILDAQFFGLAQRRERVFVVGYLGDWRRAAAVLFERQSLLRDTPPSREAGERVARPVAAGSPRGSGYRNDADTADNLVAFGGNDTRGPIDIATAVNAHGGPHGRLDFESETFVAHTLRGEGFDASEDGTASASVTPTLDKSKTPAIAFSAKDHGADAGELAPTLRAGGHAKSHANACVMPAVAFTQNSRSEVRHVGGDGGIVGALAGDHGVQQQNYIAASAVRRLTPVECEKLQGFPPNYTLVPYRGKPAADGPRYKALGNSMAVPCMRWIGERIAMVEALTAIHPIGRAILAAEGMTA